MTCQASGDFLASSSSGSWPRCHAPGPPNLPCDESRSRDTTRCQAATKLRPVTLPALANSAS
jgi:hypothetical protein